MREAFLKKQIESPFFDQSGHSLDIDLIKVFEGSTVAVAIISLLDVTVDCRLAMRRGLASTVDCNLSRTYTLSAGSETSAMAPQHTSSSSHHVSLLGLCQPFLQSQ